NVGRQPKPAAADAADGLPAAALIRKKERPPERRASETLPVRQRGSGGLLGSQRLLDLALQHPGLVREAGVAGLQQPVVDAAVMLDRAQAVARHPQAHVAAEGLADQRDDRAEERRG